jgi:hypothetical protein
MKKSRSIVVACVGVLFLGFAQAPESEEALLDTLHSISSHVLFDGRYRA